MKDSMENNDTRELLINRTVNAPIDLVWEVWTQPEHIAQWWGPTGFSNTITKMDMVEGGEWKLTMHGPDGTNYPSTNIFKEVIKFKRICYEHFHPHFIATIDFEADGEQTHIKWHMLFDTAEILQAVIKAHNAAEGLSQNIEKLKAYLANKMNNNA